MGSKKKNIVNQIEGSVQSLSYRMDQEKTECLKDSAEELDRVKRKQIEVGMSRHVTL